MGNDLEIFCDVSREKVRALCAIGPFPPSDGFNLPVDGVLIVGYTRCTEAIPVSILPTEAVAKASSLTDIAYGVPAIRTTDQEASSSLCLLQPGNVGNTTNSNHLYHPSLNGMVERLHRTFQASWSGVTIQNGQSLYQWSCWVCECASRKTSMHPALKWYLKNHCASRRNL
ncbi:hypothetical protein TNIN_461781 [Trichonephila inaurata madagascariensis]|uniref:Integrase catalytic domain-containing protein n=1 Tax=Trichonephila inaurata madagascariensis TaxID=2747483 RepID=A0A8X6Y6S0_9ARAC|nr:hypothetical protein TNIN_461781 [Trichonephila inaurata madagascariensis]